MHRGEAAENGVIADAAMAGERRVIDEGDVVPERAIVRDVRSDQKQASVADPGEASASRRPRIDRDVFADRAFRADFEAALFAAVFAILRRQSNAGERKDLGARPDVVAPPTTTWL